MGAIVLVQAQVPNMRMFELVIFAVISCAYAQLTGSAGDITDGYFGLFWSYKGPDSWINDYENCNDERQSPIDIDTSSVMDTSECSYLNFKNYDHDITGELVHDGHTIDFNVNDGDDHSISGGTLSNFGDNDGDHYHLLQLHFHWGWNSKEGSEHTIDGRKFPLEVHLVHVRDDFPELNATALETENSLAVVGILFHIGDEDAPEMGPITDAIANGNITEYGANATLDIDLKALLKRVGPGYYSYPGSLTTPTYNQVVSWIVMEDTVSISEAQMEQFRQAEYSTTMNPMVKNYRPTQPLNNRFVKRVKDFVFDEEEYETSSSESSSSSF